jgi:RHS repeat-associated protein
MKTATTKFAIVSMVLTGLLGFSCPSWAVDSPENEFTPKNFSLIDANGVDLAERALNIGHSISIGDPASGGMSYDVSYSSNGVWKFYQSSFGFLRYDLFYDPDTGLYSEAWALYFQGAVEAIYPNAENAYTGDLGSRVNFSSTTGALVNATLSDGTVLLFDPTPISVSYTGTIYRVTTATRPDGQRSNYHYTPGGLSIRSITNNRGYQLRFYTNDPSAGGLQPPTSVVLFNMAVDPCDPAAATCPAFSRTWPRLNFEYGAGFRVTAVTETSGARTAYTYGSASQAVEGIDGPGTRDTTITYQNCGPNWPNGNCVAGGAAERPGGYRVSTVTKGGRTWTYTWDPALTSSYWGDRGVRVTTSSGYVGYHTLVWQAVAVSQNDIYLPASRIYRMVDQLGRITKFEFAGHTNLKVSKIVHPEGNEERYAYDQRMNLASVTRVPVPGSTLANTVITITRGESGNTTICVQSAYCNKPVLIRDARQYVRRYTWDMATGLMTSSERGLQGLDNNLTCSFGTNLCPKVVYGHSPLSAYYYNALGQMAAGTPIQVLTTSSGCEDVANCTASAQIVRTPGYGATGVGNNLLVRTLSVGKSGVTRTTSYTYDAVGNRIQIDGPRTDVTDVTNYAFDHDRRPTDTVFADGSATRKTYSPEGYVATFELGTSTGLGQFSAAQVTTSTYDGGGNLIKAVSPVGVTQLSYDSTSRLVCTSVRMNPAVYGSLPSDACVHSTAGANGPDRITRNLYNAAGEVTTIQRAYGTPIQENYATFFYTLNGKQDWVQDANGNRSDFTYDGFGRLTKLMFPSTGLGANAPNPTDYELYDYDANDNRTSLRLRSGETISIAPDALNRESFRDLPGGTTDDVYTTYDLLNRKKTIRYQGISGPGLDYLYDAWGGVLTETSFGRVLTFAYDEAGNRSRITWPDSNFVQYTFDNVNRIDLVKENGATSGPGVLADYSYDALGRRAGVALGNGATTSVTYDSGSRFSTLTQNLSGTHQDVILTFGYNAASQMISRVQSNDLYRYQPPVAVSQTYVPDGLNRYSSVDGTTLSYDGRNNLTNDGLRAYTYDFENRLTQVAATSGSPTQLTLTYDPRGRLRQTAGATTTQFLYAGAQLVAEFDGAGSLTRRFVPGAVGDEFLVAYEGAALTSSTRRWLHGNQQASIVGESDNTGALTGAAYAYSPFGEPDTVHGWSGSRIRYTGQISLPEVQLYHYKARVYDPVRGRFLQTDPVGFKDDLNLYTYVMGDPLNATDPDGREIRLQSQNVVPGLGNHAKVTMIPENQAKYKHDPRFQNIAPDGRRFATLGAGPDRWGALVSAPNRDINDVTAVVLNDHTSDEGLQIPGGDEDAMIEKLFELDANYNDREFYTFFPSAFNGRFNSNSYASGLLLAAGFTNFPPPPNAPGFDRPMPSSVFKRARVIIEECNETNCPRR